jgi:hypothetical protein
MRSEVICLAGVWMVYGATVCGAALQALDASPSMSWAYDRREANQSVIITMRDLPFTLEEGEGGAMLSVEGPVAWPAYGHPRLPIIVLLFEIPVDESYSVRWSGVESEDRPVPGLAPVATPGVHSVGDGVYRTVMTLSRNAVVYGKDAFWPEVIVRQETARGGGRRYMRVEIFPFQYHPVLGVLRLHRGLKVVLTKVESKSNE